MNDYIIATASTADLPRTYLDEHNIPFIAYSFTMDEELLTDDCREESRAEIYSKMRAGHVLKTSMINEYTYYEFLAGLLRTGKDVIFLDMSKAMSASFGNVLRAGEQAAADFPDRRLYIMDTCCISGGLGFLVKEMIAGMENGMSYDEVIALGEERKLKICHRFTVDDLNYLKAGGRVSNASALVGSLLGIKPVLYVPDEGTLNVTVKARGSKAALKNMLDGVLRDTEGMDLTGQKVDILQADCREDAEWLKNGLLAAHPELGEIGITYLGVVIGAHCGPGLLTIFYYGSQRQV